MLCRALFKAFTKAGLMTRSIEQLLLNRISGAAFDFMIVLRHAPSTFRPKGFGFPSR
jgi:hypothetical protein